MGLTQPSRKAMKPAPTAASFRRMTEGTTAKPFPFVILRSTTNRQSPRDTPDERPRGGGQHQFPASIH